MTSGAVEGRTASGKGRLMLTEILPGEEVEAEAAMFACEGEDPISLVTSARSSETESPW